MVDSVTTPEATTEEAGFSIFDAPMWAIGAGICGVAAIAGGVYYLCSGSSVTLPSDTPEDLKEVIKKSVADLIDAVEKASPKSSDRSTVVDYINANWADYVVGYRNSDRVRYDAVRKNLSSLSTILLNIQPVAMDAIFQKARSDLDVALGRTVDPAPVQGHPQPQAAG